MVGEAVIDIIAKTGKWGVVAFLTSWTIATALRVHDPIEDKLNEYTGEFVQFIPVYSFFAPKPGDNDFHLLYRDRLEDGSITRWEEIEKLTTFPTKTHWLWNPTMYNAKTVFDHAQNLLKIVSETNDEEEADTNDEMDNREKEEKTEEDGYSPADDSIEMKDVDLERAVVALPYISLLNYVTNHKHHENCTETQFLLMQGSLRDVNNVPLLVSNFHEVKND